MIEFLQWCDAHAETLRWPVFAAVYVLFRWAVKGADALMVVCFGAPLLYLVYLLAVVFG